MVHNVEYNWLRFLNSPYFRPDEWFCCLKEFSFFEVATSVSTDKYAIRHWEYVSPTLKKNRRIRILFDILADSEEKRWILLKKVQRAFAPEQNPSPFNNNLWKKLRFEDVYDEVWECECQVIKGIQLSDFGNEKWVWISVELISNSPEFHNANVQSYTEWRNTRFGKRLWSSLWFNWEYYRDEIRYDWVIDSPFIMKMKVVGENPVPNKKINIIHEVDWEYEWLQIDDIDELNLQIWDEITLDSDSRKIIFKRWDTSEDITWMVVLGSQRPMLRIGENIVAVDTWASEKTIEIEYEWNEVF